MFKKEELKVTGGLKVEVKDKDGNVKDTRQLKNLVVTAGLGYIASRMKEATADAMTHMAIGTGTTAAAAGQTALVTEAARQSLTSTTVSSNTVEYVAAFAASLFVILIDTARPRNLSGKEII